jgi:tetratricopeptide (TPR) repeat protein
LFREEWQREPDSPRATFGLGLLALARGDRQAAEPFFTTARTSPFAKKMATVQLAILARGRGDTALAATLEKETATLADDPPWPDPFLDDVMSVRVGYRRRDREVAELERDQRYAEAAEAYLQQIEHQPTVQAYVGAGLNFARIRDYEQAVSLLREGVRLDSESALAHYNLALVLFTKAERPWLESPGSPQLKEAFREAIEHARRATELKPDLARAYLFWGLSLKYLGESAASIAPLRKGVACLPVEIELQLALGEALLEVGQLQDAETHLENAHQIDPKDQRPVQALERLRARKGNSP